jgi:hypothetical protein
MHRYNGGEYICNEWKEIFLTSSVIHELTAPSSPESNGVADGCNPINNKNTCSMTIPAPDFASLGAEAINMPAYL